MFKKDFRLKKRNEYKEVFTKGSIKANPYLVIYYLKRSEAGREKPRVGFSVSKKLGKAVMRNYIKRRLREAIRPHLWAIKEYYNIIFIARGKIKGISFADVEKNMIDLLKKARLLK